jgi:hypothetical protein
MNPAAAPNCKSEEERARIRNERVRQRAHAAGLLDSREYVRVSGRVPARLLDAANKRARVNSDSELLELALSLLALEDDLGVTLLRHKDALAG